MKTLIINNHTKHLEELKSLFSGPAVIEIEELHYTNLDGYDLLVFSGGSNVPTVLHHPEKYSAEIAVLENSNIAIIGICLGSELITIAFGGILKELPEAHRGNITLLATDTRLQKIIGSDRFDVREGHHIGIDTLPTTFVDCAHSQHGIEIIRHITRPIVGLQFHPEIGTNEKLMEWVFKAVGLR